jgi:hypothetical protein
MVCRTCGHDDGDHRYVEEDPFMNRVCMVQDCFCQEYEPDGSDVMMGGFC